MLTTLRPSLNCKVQYLYVLFVLVATLIAVKAPAQTTTINSLERWVEKYPKRDTVWVKKALELEREYYLSQLPKAGTHTSEIIRRSIDLNFSFGIMQGYKNLANQQISKSNYKEAITAVFKKLNYLEKYPDVVEMANSYSLLGRIYSLFKGKDQESINYYSLAVKQAETLPMSNTKRRRLVAGHSSNLATAYVKIKNYDKGLVILMDALKTAQGIKTKDKEYYYLLFSILQNIGNAHNLLGHFTQSNRYLQQGLDIVEKQKISIGLTYLYSAFCNNYIGLGQFDKANQKLAFIKEKKDANELNAEDTKMYFQIVADVKEKQKDFEKAYFALKEGVKLDDSLKIKEQQEAIQELSIKYETEKKEQENKLLQSQNAQVTTRNQLYLVAIAAILGLLVVSGGFYYKLRKKSNDLATLNQIKDRLFSIIAHDLKRPAIAFQNVVASFTFLLKKQQYDRLHQMGVHAQAVAADMNLIVDNLFRWGLTQQQKNVVTVEEVNIVPVIRDAVAEFASIATQKQVHLSAHLPEELHCETDKTIVSIVVRNLLSNALKFTDQEGSVTIEVEDQPTQYLVHVIDTGMGIAPHLLEKLFVLDTTKSRKGTKGEQGAGLGLLLCKELIELLQGSLFVKSEENKGSVFTISLNKKRKHP